MCPKHLNEHIQRTPYLGRSIERVTVERVKNCEKCAHCVSYSNVLNVQTYYFGAESLLDEMGVLIAVEPPY